MIIDKIKNSDLYRFNNERILNAIKYIRETDFANLSDGKYELQGEELYAIVSSYKTKNEDDAFLEAHRKYIDVQYVFKGSEKVGYIPYNNQAVYKEYDAENDYMLFSERCDYILFNEGMFAIFFPEDLHKPGIKINDSADVKKIVVKVKI